jgi:hypothetical protein
VVLEDNYERIFKAELQSWCRDPALWPSPRTFALFREWCQIRFFDLVEAFSREELKHHDVDKAFVKQVRQTLQDSPRP